MLKVEAPNDEGQKKEVLIVLAHLQFSYCTQAVDTLIGEVFDDVSFDEFEENAVRFLHNTAQGKNVSPHVPLSLSLPV